MAIEPRFELTLTRRMSDERHGIQLRLLVWPHLVPPAVDMSDERHGVQHFQQTAALVAYSPPSTSDDQHGVEHFQHNQRGPEGWRVVINKQPE